MSVCASCGGVIGRDCFNPTECAAITRQMAMETQQPNPIPPEHVQDALTLANDMLGKWEDWNRDAGQTAQSEQDTDVYYAVMREHIAAAIAPIFADRATHFAEAAALKAEIAENQSCWTRQCEENTRLEKRVDELWRSRNEAVEYSEGVDVLLDGLIPTKDEGGKSLWLKERVQLLIDQNEEAANKLSDCWLLLDEIARNAPKMTSVRATCENMLRKHKCPGWRE